MKPKTAGSVNGQLQGGQLRPERESAGRRRSGKRGVSVPENYEKRLDHPTNDHFKKQSTGERIKTYEENLGRREEDKSRGSGGGGQGSLILRVSPGPNSKVLRRPDTCNQGEGGCKGPRMRRKTKKGEGNRKSSAN